MEQEQQDRVCAQCGKPGGRRRVDPYELELYGKRMIIRLHDRCVQDRLDEI